MTELTDPNWQAKILERYPDVFQRLDVSNWEQAIALQQQRHRELPSEQYADDFAVAIMNQADFKH